MSTRSLGFAFAPRRVFVALAGLFLVAAASAPCLVRAQSDVAPSADEPPADAGASLAELREELVRQRQELERQAAELEQERAALAARTPTPTSSSTSEGNAITSGDALAEADADLAAILADAQAEALVPDADEPTLRFYGFADVGWQRVWGSELTRLLPSTANTFVLGNLNLYIDANPSTEWRMLAEVRLGLFPHESDPRPRGSFVVGAEPEDTTVADPGAPNGGFSTVRWAGVSLQRAHIDWTPRDSFNLRAGLFLTPYGIWNVDHGTPTRIMVSEPVFLASVMIPSQLLGVEAFGTFQMLPWTVGYHLHVSNGRTVGQVDPSDDKAIGGRLFLSTRYPYPFKVGISGYMGTSQEIARPSRAVVIDFSERALSADVSLDVGAFRLRSEMVMSWTTYVDGKRRTLVGQPVADSFRAGGYLVLAYQLPWYGIEPYLSTEVVRIPTPRAYLFGEGFVSPGGGLNVYFTPSTMLRTQFSYSRGFDFSDDPVDTSRAYIYQVAARLITAF